jgi:hypothetical protein
MYLRESLVDWDVVDFDSLQNGWVIEFLVKDPIGMCVLPKAMLYKQKKTISTFEIQCFDL